MMKISINGEFCKVKAKNLHELKAEICGDKAVISVIDGYATSENMGLSEDLQIIFVPKNELPPQKDLEIMISSRNTPGVYEKLKSSKVAVCGCGGLGSNLALILARVGVGNLHLIDFDSVDCTNLNRQNYFISDLGEPKIEALKRQISQINPYIKVKTTNEKISAQNLSEILRDDDIICECFDEAVSKALLVENVLAYLAPKVVVASSGLAGLGSANEIKTKKINPRFYLCGDFTSGARRGVGLMSPRVAITAGHQANAVIREILKENDE